MSRFSRNPWPWIVGLDVLPPTLLVAMGHPWLGVAALGALLGSSTLLSVLHLRSAQEQHRAILSFAQDATTMGGDPSPVIAALRGGLDSRGEPAAAAQESSGATAEPRPLGGELPFPPWSRPPSGDR